MTTVFCNESGEYFVYRSDEHGFHNPLGLYAPGTIDMVLIGDSFTHGACVKTGEDLGGQLRGSNRRVLNLGYGSNGPLIELATLSEYASHIRPRIVLWLYTEGNDLDDLAREQSSSFLMRYLDRSFSQGLLGRQGDLDRVFLAHLNTRMETQDRWSPQFLDRTTRLLHLIELRAKLELLFDPPSPPLTLFRQILTEANARVSASGGQLYLVYLPCFERYATGVKPPFWRDEVLSMAEQLRVPVIDFHQVLGAHHDPLSLFPYRRKGHYTAEGYRLLADQIRSALSPRP